MPGLCVTLVQTPAKFTCCHVAPATSVLSSRMLPLEGACIISIIHELFLSILAMVPSLPIPLVAPVWIFLPDTAVKGPQCTVNDSNLACGQDVADACMFLSLSVTCRSHCPVMFALSQSACVLGSRFALSQSAWSISTSSRWCLRYLLSVSPLPGDVVAVCQNPLWFALSQSACVALAWQ